MDEGSRQAGPEASKAGQSRPDVGMWSRIGVYEEQLPFFRPTEDLKANGFKVLFLSDGPRKETESKFEQDTIECWFDVLVYPSVGSASSDIGAAKPVKMTWTISQISLLTELKRLAPLNGKTFEIKLIKVDDDWKKLHAKFRGTRRYLVTPVSAPGQSQAKPASAPAMEEIDG